MNLELLICIGVWMELAVGVFVAWMTWQIMTSRQRARISRWLSPFLRTLHIKVGH